MSHAVGSDLRPPAAQTAKRRLAIQTPFVNRMQLRHFILYIVLPAIGTLAAVAWTFFHPIGKFELGLLCGMWALTGLGVSAGYHRLFTHRSFEATASVRVTLAVLGSMAGLGPLISWAAIHRRHHELADEPGDMHSPNLHGHSLGGRIRGFVHAQFSWAIKHDYPNIAHYTPDLLHDRAIARVSALYPWWVLLGLALPAAVGGLVSLTWIGLVNGFLWGGVVRMFIGGQLVSAVNSVAHTIGSHPFALRDNSRNNVLLALLTWGEGWHHNHHAFPSSASFGLAWYRIDMAYWLILLLDRFGLVWDVRVPTKEQIASRVDSHPFALADATLVNEVQ